MLIPEDRFPGAALQDWWAFDYRADTLDSLVVFGGVWTLVLLEGGAAGSHWYEERDGYLRALYVLGDFDVCMDSQVLAGDLSGPPGDDNTAKQLGLAAHDPTRTGGLLRYVHMGHGRAPNMDAGSALCIEHKTTIDNVTTWNTIAHPNPGTGRCWLRLQRTGATFRGYWSADGVTWNLAATWDRPDMPELLEVGVVLYAQSDVADIAGRVFSVGNTPSEATTVSNSTSIEEAILDWWDGDAYPAAPATAYLVVSTTEISDTTWDATEPDDAAYARIPIVWGATAQADGRSVKASSAPCVFDEATEDWGELVDGAVVDTISGTPTHWRRASSWLNRTVQAGGVLTIPAGAVILRQG